MKSTLLKDMEAAAKAGDTATLLSLLDSVRADAAHKKRALRCLFLAIARRNEPMTRALLGWGVDPNGVGTARMRPLTGAAYANDPVITRLLIERGADFQGHGRPWTPLMGAALMRSLDAARVLVKAGADLDAGGAGNPLSIATGNGDVAFVRFLLERGARPDTPHHSALRPAVGCGHFLLVRMLLEAGAQTRRELPTGGEMWDALNFARQQREPGAAIIALLEAASRGEIEKGA